MSLPNFLIVGAQRSGTTSLHAYLKQHPDIFMPDWKELSFFVEERRGSVKTMEDYRALFAQSGDAKAVGESSPDYMHEEGCAERILEVLGRIKIIFTLRNPVDMAYSLWNLRANRYGHEDLSFEEALRREPERMADPEFRKTQKGWYRYAFYFHCGLYFEPVKRYMEVFGPENVKVIIFEEFKERTLETCRELFGFLGVDQSFEPDISRRNVNAIPRSGLLMKLFVKARHNPLVDRLYSALPMALKLRVYKVAEYFLEWNKKPWRAEPLDESLRTELTRRYMDDIRSLEGLLGRDLSVWYTGRPEA